MKFIADRDNLLHALQLVQRAVSPKNPMPILSGIKFEVSKDRIFLSATDLNVGIKCSLPVEVLSPGAAVLPARYIIDLIRRLPGLPAIIESDEITGSVRIKYGQSEAVINGFPVEEFPEVSLSDSKVNLSISEKNLKDIVRQVVFAASSDENRPVYNGVLFEIYGRQVVAVATDTHRLAWRRFSIENQENIDIKLIIPGKTLNDLVKIIGNSEDNIKITANDKKVYFISNGIFLVSRLIDGQFPNYQVVVPKEFTTRVTLKTSDLAEAAERASLLEKEGSPVININLQENVILLTANTEAGRLSEEIPVYREGEAIQIAFNARYLSEALKATESE
ncbi:MAG: DNA polymerase III subunit beta, partial [Pelotomaculum thermopropionicum]